jgi:hypothetical protein
MSEILNLGDGCCCKSSISGLRMLILPNGAQIGIMGLDTVMEDFYKEGEIADNTTALEMLFRLEKQNYFSPSARTIYQELISSEYQRYYETKIALLNKEKDKMASQDNNQNTRKKGIFNLFKSDKKAANEGGCCNMKIVPKDQPSKEAGKGCCCNIKIVPKEQSAEDKLSQK